MSNQQPGAKGAGNKQQSGAGRASSGVINATQLPPLSGQRGQHPEGIEEDMNEQMMDEMDMEGMDMDPYGDEEGMDGGMEMEEEDDEAITFEQIRDTIEKVEDKGKDQVQQARDSKYISKGTYIW
jgi:hypothetical protein